MSRKNDLRYRVKIPLPKLATVAPDELLRNPHYAQLLAIVTWCLTYEGAYISRRTLIDVLADVFRDAEAEIVTADGKPFDVPDLDDVFEPTGFEDRLDQQHCFEWCGAFMRWALEPARVIQDRSVEKLRLIDAAWKAGGPRLWRPDGPQEVE